MTKEEIKQLNRDLKGKPAEEIVAFFISKYGSKIALASSLGAEDQVLTHMVASASKDATVFTLDTGRLFPETYQLIDETNSKYNIKIKTYFPKHDKVEEMVNTKGINLFYESIENRKECCHVRKIEPLTRAFSSLDAWICGLRQEQSITRFGTDMVEWDENNELVKINPLFDWTEKRMWEYIKEYDIPYNKLHDKGYPSIGCQPCTRAVKEGEDIRTGRWWWENPESKECGLHKR